ncbi:GerAB/ArcD/ProY family transporter [Sedimentibacter saalensis]|jgi:spore germination protein (amino acid permease)|uniref:Spore germination protein (Amino acid permease) n=2 Tax=root TaxID=1 RepID=A0A562J4A5_9FIRM|nr:endospore germination permease [Sedimentibacter saalensis]TWH77893.1 spore germination protein (amino acid permease) [Sedimentibacter saalensis]
MFNQDITPYQNISILILVSFAFQSLLMPSILSEIDGPVGWISIAAAALLLYLAIRPVNKLMEKHSEDTIISISNKLFPKFISKSIGLYYIFMFLISNSILLKDFSEQIKLMMLFNTPLSTIIIAILLTAGYAAKKGIQTIANITNIAVIVALIPYLLIIIFSTYYADYTNILPIYPADVVGVAKSIPFAMLGFFGFSILMFSNSRVAIKEKNLLINKRFIVISAILYIACYLLIVVKFGMKEAVNMVWPFISVMKFVNIPGFFFESTEIVGLCFQIVVTFTCICILSYFTNLSMQETFKTRENGYFIFIQIPILYLMAAALPGMYMMFPYIRIPIYALSALNFLIPLLVAYKNKLRVKNEELRIK